MVSNESPNDRAENPLARGAFVPDNLSMTLTMKQFVSVDSGSAVSSVVEHFLDTEGVRGSNPLSRTISSESNILTTPGERRFGTKKAEEKSSAMAH